MVSGIRQRARRSGELARAFTPLIPQIAAMGNNPDRRQRFGCNFGKQCIRLGGIYPWIAEMLADVPILAGPSVAAGLREVSRDPLGPFAVSSPLSDGFSVRAHENEGNIEVDLDLLDSLLGLVTPLTGRLHSRTSKALFEVLRVELSRESSLAEEARQRELLGRADATVLTIPLVRDGDGRWRVTIPKDLEVGPSRFVLMKSVRTWSAFIIRSGLIPARLEWTNCAIDDEDRLVLLGRLAGSTTARPQIQAVTADLVTAMPPHIPESLIVLLTDELQSDHEDVSGLASSIMSLIDPQGWHVDLGPLRSLRAVDSAAGRAAKPLQIGLDVLLLVRQLALFRSMADDLDIGGSYFTAVWANGE